MPRRLELAKEIISLWKKFKIRKQKCLHRDIRKKLTIRSLRNVNKNLIYYRYEIKRLESEFGTISGIIRDQQFKEIKKILNRLKHILKQLLEKRDAPKRIQTLIASCKEFTIDLPVQTFTSQQKILAVNSPRGIIICQPREITINLYPLPDSIIQQRTRISNYANFENRSLLIMANKFTIGLKKLPEDLLLRLGVIEIPEIPPHKYPNKKYAQPKGTSYFTKLEQIRVSCKKIP